MRASEGAPQRVSDGIEPTRPVVVPLPAVTDDFWQRFLALRPRLAAYLRAMLPDHHAVDDVLQETCVVLAQRYADSAEADLAPLAFTCARNKAHSWLEKNRVERLSIIDPEILRQIAEAAAEQATGDPVTGHSARVEALRTCLDKLTREQRQLVEARYGSDRNNSITSLADGTTQKVDALYKKLERLRTALKRCVTEKLAIAP